MRLSRAAVFIIVLLCANPIPADPWRNHRFDAAHTAHNAEETFDPARLEPAWTVHAGNVFGSFWSDPVIAGRTVLVGARTNGVTTLKAFSLDYGLPIWERPVDGWYVPTGPVVAGTRVVVGANGPGAHLEAYDLRTGDPVWRSATIENQVLISNPVVKSSVVYVTSGYGAHALDLQTGDQVWKAGLAGGLSLPAIGDDGRLFASFSGHHYGLDARNGRLLWHAYSVVTGGTGTTPTLGEHLYVVDRDWEVPPNYPLTIYAFTPDTGELAWKRSFEVIQMSELALAEGVLYFSDSRTLRSIQASTGVELWTFSADTPLVHAPVVAGEFLFVSSWTRSYALHLPTQSVVWSVGAGGHIVVANGWVLISEYSGLLHAFHVDSAEGQATH